MLIATFIAPDGGFATSEWSRGLLALTLIHLAADVIWLTRSTLVANLLGGAVLLTFPNVVWVAARLMGFEFFALDRREQLAVPLVGSIGILGWYVGTDKDLTCRDFVGMGDFEPESCAG